MRLRMTIVIRNWWKLVTEQSRILCVRVESRGESIQWNSHFESLQILDAEQSPKSLAMAADLVLL
jgi:hypothetical protein